MHPGTGSSSHRIFSQRQLSLALHKMENSGLSGGVFGQFLAGSKGKKDGLDLVIAVNGAAIPFMTSQAGEFTAITQDGINLAVFFY